MPRVRVPCVVQPMTPAIPIPCCASPFSVPTIQTHLRVPTPLDRWPAVLACRWTAGRTRSFKQWQRADVDRRRRIIPKLEVRMRRVMVDSLAGAVIILGAILASSPVASAAEADTCSVPNGPTCEGKVCCADDEACYTDPNTCFSMFCNNNPDAPACQPT